MFVEDPKNEQLFQRGNRAERRVTDYYLGYRNELLLCEFDLDSSLD